MAVKLLTARSVIFAENLDKGVDPTAKLLFRSFGTEFTPGGIDEWTTTGSPTYASHIVTTPQSSSLSAGNPDWQDMTFTIRAKWVTGSLGRIWIHRVDANNGIFCQINEPGGLSAYKVVGGVLTGLGSSGGSLSSGSWYWFRLQAVGTTYTFSVYADTGPGTVGALVFSLTYVIEDLAVQAGKVYFDNIQSASMDWGGAYTAVCTVFGPAPFGYATPGWDSGEASFAYGFGRLSIVAKSSSQAFWRPNPSGDPSESKAQAVTPGATYNWTGKVRAVAVTGSGITMRLIEFNASGGVVADRAIGSALTGTSAGWVAVGGIFTVSGTTAYVSLRLNLNGTGTAQFMDFYLVGSAVDQTNKVIDGSLSLKLKTLDFALKDPATVPILGDVVTFGDPAWTGLITKVESRDPTDRIGHQYVIVTATNESEAYAAPAPFDLSDTPNRTTSFGYSGLKVTRTQNRDGTLKVAGSCLIRQAGLAPGMTFKLTSTNQGISAQDFTVTNVTVKYIGSPKSPTPLFSIEFGDPIVTMEVWVNSQIQAATNNLFPIDSTRITDGAVTTPKLAANSVTAEQIAAGAVTAEALAATLILASLLVAGEIDSQHVEIDANGLRAKDANGNLIVNIPSDGTDVTIDAHVRAKTLSVLGAAVLQSPNNELALGSVLQLDAHLNDPTQAPIVAQDWDSVSLPVNATYDKDATHYSRSCIFYDPAGGAGGATKTFWTCTSKADGSHEYLLELSAADRTVLRAIDLGPGGTGPGTTPYLNPVSVARLGSYIYGLTQDKYSGAGGTGYLGSTADPSPGYYDGNTPPGGTNVVSMGPYTMPEHGQFTQLTVNVGAQIGSITAYAVLWDGGGTVRATGAIGVNSNTPPGTHSVSIPTIDAPAGSQWYFGIYWAKADGAYWGVNTGGSYFKYSNNQSSLGGPGGSSCNTGQGFYACGSATAYGTYQRITSYSAWKVRRYSQSSLALDATYDAVSFPIATPVTPLLSSDGASAIAIVDRDSSIKLANYDAAMNMTGGPYDTTYNPGGALTAFADGGNFDFGAARWLVAAGGVVHSFSGTTRQPDEQFQAASAIYGLTYGDALGDGARFWSIPQLNGVTAKSMTKHSTWVWTSASSLYWIGYSWADTNATGGTHDTGISPRASITMIRRARLTITAQDLPGAGGVDDPNNINFYVLPAASDPGATNFKRQAQQASKTVTLIGYNASGAADVSNNYPSGSPAQIKSQMTGWSVKGDGTYAKRFRAKAYCNTATTVTAAGIILPFNVKLWDPNSNFDIATNKGRYTAPVAGYYYVAGAFRVSGQAEMILDVKVTGVWKARLGLSGTAGAFVCSGSTVVQMDAGDYVELAAYLPNGNQSLNGQPEENWMVVEYMGDSL